MLTKIIAMMTRAIDEAIELLRDEDLVWSYDIQNIKGDLVALLLVCAAQDNLTTVLADNLAKKICMFEEDNHVAVYDPELEKRDA
jgi:hypothetical protein